MRDKGYWRLASLYGLYFVALGASSFTAVYLGGKNMDNAQIGMLLSVPPLLAMALQAVWGLAGDRARLKRNVMAIAYLGTGLGCFLIDAAQGVWPLLLAMVFYNCFSQGPSPILQAICMEYTRDKRGGFGPIRMVGSITYQVVVLLAGFVLSGTMPQLFRLMGVIYVACSAWSIAMPPVEGHQHAKEKKVSPLLLLRDRRVVLLLAMMFCGRVACTFYVSFFNKYVQESYASNSIMSLLSFAGIMLESPILLFSSRWMKKMKIMHWALVGFALNAVRFIGISMTQNLPVLFILQIIGPSSMICFEFYPALYLDEIAPKELSGSVQSLTSIVATGISQLAGSLVGGFAAEALGLQRAFGVYGVFLLLAMLLFIVPARRVNMDWQTAGQSAKCAKA